MKRHEALKPLSREHHPALVQAKRLRDFRGTTKQVLELSQDFLQFWDMEIAQHFRDEEELLLPLMAQRAGDDSEEILETVAQHVKLRRAILELRRCVEAGKTPQITALNALGDALKSHVRFEEDKLFPAAEAHFVEADLDYLARALNR